MVSFSLDLIAAIDPLPSPLRHRHRHHPPPQRLSSQLRFPGLPFRVIQILEVRTRLGYGT
ncbi:hypothetical protein Hanom_Chr10g00875761 [Helianthus anomalus]